MNNVLLKEKIKQIILLQKDEKKEVKQELLSGFESALMELKDWESFRMNPVYFSEKYNFSTQDVLNLFIYGTKVGLFSFEWSLLCPTCGGREHSHNSLNQLAKESYHCTMCDIDVEVEADSHLEVCFTMLPQISGFWADPLKSFENYRAYYFSNDFVPSKSFLEYLSQGTFYGFSTVNPGETIYFEIEDVPSKKYRMMSLETHSIFTVQIRDEKASSVEKIEIEHSDKGFSRKSFSIATGKAVIAVTNTSKNRIGVMLVAPDSSRLAEIFSEDPPTFKPFISGKMMLNSQIFRELFLIDNLPNDLSLKVNDISLMFTDLKGSTELYGRTGDVNAYRLVQEHFGILQQSVQENQGAIVKTMGDAIMASFCSPLDAMLAASAMLKKISEFNNTMKDSGSEIGLKVGLHRGPVIAVKANQTLDYFGQTVNVTARIQGLAESGEIWLSDEMQKDQKLQQVLEKDMYSLTEQRVNLKGVGGLTTVYQCRP